jgi:hypothetical protein
LGLPNHNICFGVQETQSVQLMYLKNTGIYFFFWQRLCGYDMRRNFRFARLKQIFAESVVIEIRRGNITRAFVNLSRESTNIRNLAKAS